MLCICAFALSSLFTTGRTQTHISISISISLASLLSLLMCKLSRSSSILADLQIQIYSTQDRVQFYFLILFICSWIMFRTLVRLFDLKLFLNQCMFSYVTKQFWYKCIMGYKVGFNVKTWLLLLGRNIRFIISSSLLLILLTSWFVEFLGFLVMGLGFSVFYQTNRI